MVWVLAVAGKVAVQLAVAVPALVPDVTGATGAAWQDAAGFHVPVEVKVKYPEGKIGPVIVGDTVAVKVTVSVAMASGSEEIRDAAVEVGLTSCGNTADVAAGKFGSPPYTATMG
jgi:hypothetical protein